ncbi:chain length determinant protein tyrosine kinase EpsG [Pseudoduganella sp. FT55W]|uniref:Chain length determinant protein tyrosine kinase EpsG n=1 Tax=Duganella rivi TaxID=2666083 RepID=A0A7X4GKS6_9BURK|nr:chain length determinant protein tyrosine kinase EpsG [Duganella rivi]MYM65293.1 chain length determinant protein tyrosine kinase EpsG [Duganella rivi]
MNSSVLSTPAPQQASGRGDSSIGGLLLESGKISPENAERVLRMQKELGIRFGEAAQRLGLITEADIQQVLARQFDYPYLQKGESNYSPLLVAAYEPFSAQVETLRAVRSQLMLRWFASHKSLAIAGINSGDGVSTFAANLAIVFSQLGENTLLVDANLRTPSQHATFNSGARQGLSDALAGRAGLDVITRIPAFLSLSLLAAGTLPPNPQELLSRASFRNMSTELEAQHDIVLYDVPPFSVGADALAIASRVGGVLLVARKNHTLVADINAMTEQLSHSGAKVVGAVMVDF